MIHDDKQANLNKALEEGELAMAIINASYLPISIVEQIVIQQKIKNNRIFCQFIKGSISYQEYLASLTGSKSCLICGEHDSEIVKVRNCNICSSCIESTFKIPREK